MRKPKKQYNRHPLYKVRSTSEKMNVAFDFVRENWRQWLKFSLYFLLPLSVIQASVGNALMNVIFAEKDFTGSLAVIGSLVFFVGLAVDTALMIMLIKWCLNHTDGLSQCTMSHLWRVMPQASAKCLLAWLIIVIITIPVMVISVLGSLIIPLLVVIVFFVLLPVLIICPIYLLEENVAIVPAAKRAFSLGYKRWGEIILVALVMLITVMMLGNAIHIPYFFALFFQEQFSSGNIEGSFVWKMVLDAIVYVLTVMECFSWYLGLALFTIVLTYHYGSVAAAVEDIALVNDIDDFANL